MGCINCTLSLLDCSIKTEGPVDDLNHNKDTQCNIFLQYLCGLCRNMTGKNSTISQLKMCQWKYRNVIIDGFGNSSNCNVETASSNFLNIKKHFVQNLANTLR
jgi:hypothetical protein